MCVRVCVVQTKKIRTRNGNGCVETRLRMERKERGTTTATTTKPNRLTSKPTNLRNAF